jgi:dTDP-4-dehydrorhamnose 3,5-epimerase
VRAALSTGALWEPSGMRFEVVPTRLDGPLLIEPAVFGDDRGFFCETFRLDDLATLGVAEPFVQDNHSRSKRGTIRGIHFQIGAGASKLVRCGRGTIVDVLVDLRRDSPTFGEWEAFELSDETMRMLYAPIGFGHGFCVTSDVADVLYKQSAYYSSDVERGISFLDPAIGIDWPVPREDWIFSQRDAEASTLDAFDEPIPQG